MNRRVKLVLVVALVVAALAGILVVTKMSGGGAASAPKISTLKIVSVKTPKKVGDMLKDDVLVLVDFAGTPPQGAVRDKQSLIGRGVISDIFPGEPIMEGRLAPKGSGAGLAPVIPPGMRSMAIRVDSVADLAGFATPGARVDVLAMGVPPASGNTTNQTGAEVRTILQNIQVLSAAQNIQKDAEGKPQAVDVVNLLVTPDQAQTLSLAATQAHVQLSLRNPMDNGTDPVIGNNLKAMYEGSKPVEKVAKVARPQGPGPVRPRNTHSVEVLNGSKSSVVNFPEAEGQL